MSATTTTLPKLSARTLGNLRKYGAENCRKAYRLNVHEGMGASTIACSTPVPMVTTQQVDAAIATWDAVVKAYGTDLIVPCLYCGGHGEGSYWVHSLESTIDAPCHACHAQTVLRPAEVEDVLVDLSEEDRTKYEQG
jgi:hypothetical protein